MNKPTIFNSLAEAIGVAQICRRFTLMKTVPQRSLWLALKVTCKKKHWIYWAG